MITVGQNPTINPPCAVASPILAAGKPPINTVAEPTMITSGGPVQTHMSVRRAAGNPPINTVGAPGDMIGPPTCGTTPVTIGQICMSVSLAANPISFVLCLSYSIDLYQRAFYFRDTTTVDRGASTSVKAKRGIGFNRNLWSGYGQ